MDAVASEGVAARCLHVAVIKQLTLRVSLGLCVIPGLLVCFYLLCALTLQRFHSNMIAPSLKFKQQM